MMEAVDIHKIHNRYNIELTEKKREIVQQITQWRDDYVREIDEYAYQQKKILNEEYGKQRNSLQRYFKILATKAISQENENDTE